MGTKTLTDIHNDLKLLIIAISGFEEDEECFQICERSALSQIKHHRYLSVNSHAVKKEIEELTQKFLIYGKYDVAKEFQELINSFLTNFDFEKHPQYDLQWSLLSLLLNLANETNKSELSNSSRLSRDCSQNIKIATEEDKSEEINWTQYLKEGQEDFFCNYESGSDSEWSEDENDGQLDTTLQHQQNPSTFYKNTIPLGINAIEHSTNEFSITDSQQETISRRWLTTNVQNCWWGELVWNECKVDSEFETAHLHKLWKKNILIDDKISGTISEYKACRELLWMFHAQTTMALFQTKNRTEYSIQDVSIPSLSMVAFKSMLSSYCEYITMMQEIEIFLDKLFKQKHTSSQNRKPPLTYEAYAVALQQEFINIKKGLVEFERQIMKQENQNTLLSMSKMLKKYLDRMKIIFEIHKTVEDDWEKLTNWQCASKLLSNLYFKMQNSSNYESINLCASLYLASISVYLNIIDVWLSEGRLEDWRKEFIIYRCNDTTESITRDDMSSIEGFACRKLDSLCSNDPIMNCLRNKVYQMGRSVELLVTLDRISDLWYMMDQEKVLTKTLNEECLKEILAECSKYDYSSFSDLTDSASLNIVEISIPQSYDADIEQHIMQQVSATNNPFLTKALENFIFPELSLDDIDGRSNSSNQSVEFKKDTHNCKLLEYLSTLEMVLPLKKIFECAISKVLDFKFSRASKLVKDILIREYKLETQLKLMRSVYMMETSHVMNKFCKIIFTKIESNGMWNNAHFISCILEEVLSQEWPDSTSRWSITFSNVRTIKVLEAVNGIILNYAAGWPINMLLNEEALDKYNKIFRFELKLKWALWTLNTLRFDDLECIDKLAVPDIVQHFHIRRLESLRFWLLHAIGSIHAYLSGQVLQSLGTVFEKALMQADNLEAIVTIHNEYLDNVHEHCLQTEKFEDLTLTIHKLLEMCEEIRDKWKPESLVFIGSILDRFENDYVKYHTFLALALHNSVQHKDADYHKLLLPNINSLNNENEFYSVKDQITDLGRNILNEIAYQTFPPSGISINLPGSVMESMENSLDLRSLRMSNEFEQAFTYLYWRGQKGLESEFDLSSSIVDDTLFEIEKSRFQNNDNNF